MTGSTGILFSLLLAFLVKDYSPLNSGPEKQIWLVKSASSLMVDGKTNVNHFSCEIPAYGRTDTLVCERTTAFGVVFAKSNIAIPVVRFDCGLKMMTKDLQKTLKQDQYPFMYIDFRQFSGMPDVAKQTALSGYAVISLAGVSRKYQIQCTSRQLNAREIELRGTKQIKLTDFQLQPPSKLGGTIRVEDQLDVRFTLHLMKI